MFRKLLYITIVQVLLLRVATLIVTAQPTIVVNQEFSKCSNYDFNEEWHYLTSDLYFFNSDKLCETVSNMYSSFPKKRRIILMPESVLITATINGTSFDGITYPIYELNVSNQEYTSRNYEAIRIIDNLPLSSVSNGVIDCKINVNLITKDKPNVVYDFVASQLKNVASLTTPLAATKIIVDELSSLLTARTVGSEYKFSSTIKLYDATDFNKQIASLSVYSLIPSNVSDFNVDSTTICNLLDTCVNPTINRSVLQNSINCDYPFFVVVNYKSKYVSEPVIGDETTIETVKARLSKVKRAYSNGLLSNEIYNHELKFIDYLDKFVDLKSTINNYLLNKNNRITDDYSKQYALIFDKYTLLTDYYNARLSEFGNDPIFKNEFLSLYQSITTNANGYFDSDHNLKNIRNIVSTMGEYQRFSSKDKYDSKKVENVLAVFHSINFGKSTESNAVENLNLTISKIENLHFENVFRNKVEQLDKMSPSAQSTQYCTSLKNEVNATYCNVCKERSNTAIADYTQRLEVYNNRVARQKLDSIATVAKSVVIESSKKENIISKNFDDKNTQLLEEKQYIYEDLENLKSRREKLQELLKKAFQEKNTT